MKLKAMYESNFVGTRSRQKVLGHLATFEKFPYATSSCRDLKDDHGSIHVDYNSPTVAKF